MTTVTFPVPANDPRDVLPWLVAGAITEQMYPEKSEIPEHYRHNAKVATALETALETDRTNVIIGMDGTFRFGNYCLTRRATTRMTADLLALKIIRSLDSSAARHEVKLAYAAWCLDSWFEPVDEALLAA